MGALLILRRAASLRSVRHRPVRRCLRSEARSDIELAHRFGFVGGPVSDADSINDPGDVVGAATDNNRQWHGVLFDHNGNVTDFGTSTTLRAINADRDELSPPEAREYPRMVTRGASFGFVTHEHLRLGVQECSQLGERIDVCPTMRSTTVSVQTPWTALRVCAPLEPVQPSAGGTPACTASKSLTWP